MHFRWMMIQLCLPSIVIFISSSFFMSNPARGEIALVMEGHHLILPVHREDAKGTLRAAAKLHSWKSRSKREE